MAIRKSVTNLTAAEKAAFVQGVKTLKANGRYDAYVHMHHHSMERATPAPGEPANPATRNAAHRGPAFLPWHREYILRFEQELQGVLGDANFGLPSWDWAADAALTNPIDPVQAVVWRDDFMGWQGDPVTSGPFRQGEWVTVSSGNLIRQFGTNVPSLPTQAQVNAALETAIYDTPPWHSASASSFRNLLEGWQPAGGPHLHNRVHVWVGGSMLPDTSPDDPVFFLHHCNVDRIWALWQTCNPQVPYAPTNDVATAPPGHRLNDQMFPWTNPGDRTIADLLEITALGYSYDDFHRRFVTLRRQQGTDRFVSEPQIIEVTTNCDTQSDTAGTIFLPAALGNTVRARLELTPDDLLTAALGVAP